MKYSIDEEDAFNLEEIANNGDEIAVLKINDEDITIYYLSLDIEKAKQTLYKSPQKIRDWYDLLEDLKKDSNYVQVPFFVISLKNHDEANLICSYLKEAIKSKED